MKNFYEIWSISAYRILAIRDLFFLAGDLFSIHNERELHIARVSDKIL